MKKSLLASFALTLSLFSAGAIYANETVDSLKDKINEPFKAEIVKKKGQYYLHLTSYSDFDGNGSNVACCSSRNPRAYYLNRSVDIPLKIENLKKGLNLHIQAGLFDNDVITGSFSKVDNKRVGDLFTTYSGNTKDLSFIFVGGGYASAKTPNGIKLSDTNATVAFPYPGLPIGISGGARNMDFEFKITTPMKAALVNYSLISTKTGKTIDEKSEVVAIEEVLNSDLANN